MPLLGRLSRPFHRTQRRARTRGATVCLSATSDTQPAVLHSSRPREVRDAVQPLDNRSSRKSSQKVISTEPPPRHVTEVLDVRASCARVARVAPCLLLRPRLHNGVRELTPRLNGYDPSRTDPAPEHLQLSVAWTRSWLGRRTRSGGVRYWACIFYGSPTDRKGHRVFSLSLFGPRPGAVNTRASLSHDRGWTIHVLANGTAHVMVPSTTRICCESPRDVNKRPHS